MFDDRTPIYRQIAGQLREDIVSGLLDDDEQVMSTTQYATFHRINPATVAKAFQELVDDGLLYKKRGLGMFVSPGARERLRDERRAAVLRGPPRPGDRRGRPAGHPARRRRRRRPRPCAHRHRTDATAMTTSARTQQ